MVPWVPKPIFSLEMQPSLSYHFTRTHMYTHSVSRRGITLVISSAKKVLTVPLFNSFNSYDVET